jgi:tripartite-type tricarboxylate transporter receptor subunit TctC
MIRAAVVLLLLVLLPSAVHAQKRVALVIGNSSYQHAGELANPKNDATDMAASLRSAGFQVIEGYDLNKAALDRKIRDFATALRGAQAGLFFYAGHGLQVSGQNYIVPVDAELTTEAALDFEMVRLDLLHRTMEREAPTNILILDACRNNPLARNLARAMGTRSAAIGRGLAAVESGAGTLISFSTQPGNVALDGVGRNSPFAGALVKHMTSSQDDLGSILIAVRNDVMEETQRKQVPWEHSAMMGRFYFKAPTNAAPPPSTSSPQANLSEAERTWNLAKDTKSSAVLKSFIQRYSDTFYADLARERIEQLQANAGTPSVTPAERPQPSLDIKTTALPPTLPNPTVSNQAAPALVREYPTRPMKMVVPFASGGGTDILGRALAQPMSESLGQPVVVEDIPGGGGVTGSKRVADAAPDGYVFVLGSVSSHAHSQILRRTPLYTTTDFTPVALIAEAPIVVVARKDLPFNSLKEFVAYAKANPGKMKYGSGGAGSVSHLACLLLNHLLGVDTVHVPYPGGVAPALVDLLGGRVDYLCEAISSVKPHIDRSTMKPIAIMSKDRSKALPNVPTGLEQGVPNLEAAIWNAIFLPKGSPVDVVKKLNDATVQAIKTPAVRERLEAMGLVIVSENHASPQYLGEFVKTEIAKWAVPIKASGITVD